MLLLLSVITREFALMSVTYFGASVLGEDVGFILFGRDPNDLDHSIIFNSRAYISFTSMYFVPPKG